MRIIKVNAIDSTNNLAKEWHQVNRYSEPVCIVAKDQKSGRGQRGASWISNAGENLTFSIVLPKPSIAVDRQFLLSAGVGLAILAVIKGLKINNLKLKWPNDIMAANHKIGGILIENILTRGSIGASIVGVGLNINQKEFPSVPSAASLSSLSGVQYNLDDLLEMLTRRIEEFFRQLPNTSEEKILANYEEVLFRRNKISTFQLPGGEFLTGIIKGTSSTGLLQVEVEDAKIKNFDLKEIKLLF